MPAYSGPIIDTHHHIWLRKDVAWLADPPIPRMFGDYFGLRRDYPVEEWINDIVPQIQKTAELVHEIDAASNEQARGIDENARAIQQFDQVIQANSAAAEEMASTSEELTAQAAHLQETIAFFKVETESGPRSQVLPLPRVASIGRGGKKSSKGKGVKLSLPGAGDGDFERY